MTGPSMPKNVLIAGCGYSGKRLAHRLLAGGTAVSGLVSRPESRAALLESGIDAAVWNIDADPAPALPAASAVVYLIPPPGTGETDTRLTRFLDALADAPPTRLVYASTTGVYGNRDGATVNEQTAIRPESARAVRRADAEHQVAAWCAQHNVHDIVLRVPGIYGPGRVQLATLDSGRALLKPDEASPGNRIHVDDLVRCLDAALVTNEAGVFNVGDGDYASNTEFVSEVARQLGRDAPPLATREALKRSVGERAWSFMRESRLVDTSRMRQALGVTPRYERHRDGIAASLEEMGL